MKFKKDTKITKFKKPLHLNVGIIIFGIFLIYLLVTILLYLSKTKVTGYEVRAGSIVKDTAYTGLILRDEMVVTSSENGYINYLIEEGGKIAVHTNIFVTSPEKVSYSPKKVKDITDRKTGEQAQVLMHIQNFSERYNSNHFFDTYLLNADIQETLEEKEGSGRENELIAMIQKNQIPQASVFESPVDGVASFFVDGYENLNDSTVKWEDLSQVDYKRNSFQNNDYIKKNSPILKIIRSEDWSIVIPVKKELAQRLIKEKKRDIRVRFLSDNQILLAGLTIEQQGEHYLAHLMFDNGMIRYSKDRFIDVELILEDESGLKIPKSSLVEKEFYLVPSECITESGRGGSSGVLKEHITKGGTYSTDFIPVTVYFKDAKRDLVYVGMDEVKNQDILVVPKSTKTFVVGQKGTLKGVYNINKGYAVFRPVSILSASEDYYLVRQGDVYSLSNYDRIALNGNQVKEDAIIFE